MKIKEKADVKAQLDLIWEARSKLCAKGTKLRANGTKLRADGARLYDEGAKLWDEGDGLWTDGILKFIGNTTVKWTRVNTGNNKELYCCELGNGMVFGDQAC